MSKTAAHQATPQYEGGTEGPTKPDSLRQRSQFVSLALTMGWQLAVAVLVPVIGGVQLDKTTDMSPVFLFSGLALAVVLSTVIMWASMQRANRLPVPKLTDAQRRAVQKSYEEDDD